VHPDEIAYVLNGDVVGEPGLWIVKPRGSAELGLEFDDLTPEGRAFLEAAT
jgi:hypothetical protein